VLCRRALLIVGRPARQGGTSKAEVPQARQRMENKHDCHTRLQRSMNRAAEKIKGSRTSAEVRILCRGGAHRSAALECQGAALRPDGSLLSRQRLPCRHAGTSCTETRRGQHPQISKMTQKNPHTKTSEAGYFACRNLHSSIRTLSEAGCRLARGILSVNIDKYAYIMNAYEPYCNLMLRIDLF